MQAEWNSKDPCFSKERENLIKRSFEFLADEKLHYSIIFSSMIAYQIKKYKNSDEKKIL